MSPELGLLLGLAVPYVLHLVWQGWVRVAWYRWRADAPRRRNLRPYDRLARR